MTTVQLAANLADTEDRLACISGDLERMPSFKRGTAWHTDRVREQEYLLATIERLRTAFVKIMRASETRTAETN